MKKQLLFISFVFCITFSALAQSDEKSSRIKEKDIPVTVLEAFQREFPEAKAKWEMENGMYEADFKDQGVKTCAVFEANGNIVQTETAIKISGLPSAAIAYLNTYYKGQKIKDVARIGKANGVIHYEASVKDKDFIFDVNGKFIAEEVEK